MADQDQAQSAGQTGTISGEQAARLLMISAERVRRLVNAEYITRAGVGRYPMVGVLQGYIRFLKNEERRTADRAPRRLPWP